MRAASTPFNRDQKLIIFVLIMCQFTMVLDFMVMAPLGPIIMPFFQINPKSFSILISSYAFCAVISSFTVSFIIDRFDRKTFLVLNYIGFLLGTLTCALAQSFEVLLLGRMIAGIFGGVIASMVPTIVGDQFSEETRGLVIGYTQISFGICQVAGLPIGLYFSNLWNWHAPFLMVLALGMILLPVIILKIVPMKTHLQNSHKKDRLLEFFKMIKTKRNQLGLFCTLLLTFGAYLLMPFTSTYNVNNLKMDVHLLPLFYLFTGISVILFAPLLGKLSDRVGKLKIFVFGALFASLVVVAYVRMNEASFGALCLVNILTFVGFFSMLISFQSFMTTLPPFEHRGGYMALNASVQQLGGGLAVLAAGLIIDKDQVGKLYHFSTLGYLLILVLMVCIFIVRKIDHVINLNSGEGPL